MTEAPETIWAEVLSERQALKVGSTGVWDDRRCSDDSTAYVRGDIHDAALARIAALEARLAPVVAMAERIKAIDALQAAINDGASEEVTGPLRDKLEMARCPSDTVAMILQAGAPE